MIPVHNENVKNPALVIGEGIVMGKNVAYQLLARRKASGDNDLVPATPFLPGPLPEGADHNQGGSSHSNQDMSSGKTLYSGKFNLWQAGIENNHNVSQSKVFLPQVAWSGI